MPANPFGNSKVVSPTSPTNPTFLQDLNNPPGPGEYFYKANNASTLPGERTISAPSINTTKLNQNLSINTEYGRQSLDAAILAEQNISSYEGRVTVKEIFSRDLHTDSINSTSDYFYNKLWEQRATDIRGNIYTRTKFASSLTGGIRARISVWTLDKKVGFEYIWRIPYTTLPLNITQIHNEGFSLSNVFLRIRLLQPFRGWGRGTEFFIPNDSRSRVSIASDRYEVVLITVFRYVYIPNKNAPSSTAFAYFRDRAMQFDIVAGL